MLTTYPAVFTAFRENCRLLKAIRSMTDAQIAKAGGYTSRQSAMLRLSGEVVPDLDDLVRFGAAFRVPPLLLLEPDKTTLFKWTEDNPKYAPPRDAAPPRKAVRQPPGGPTGPGSSSSRGKSTAQSPKKSSGSLPATASSATSAARPAAQSSKSRRR